MYNFSIHIIALACLLWRSISLVSAQNIVYSFTAEGCYSQLEGWNLAGTDVNYTPGTCGYTCQQSGSSMFALSGAQCYCGSAVPPPSLVSSSSSCSQQCQYYPGDVCGEQGVFVIYLLAGKQLSTAASSLYYTSTSSSMASSATSTTSSDSTKSKSTSSSTSDSSKTTSSSTSRSSSRTTSPLSTTSSAESNTPTSAASSTSSSSSSNSASPSKTDSMTPSSTSSSTSSSTATSANNSSNSKDSKKSGISGGAIAGIVVGVVAGVVVCVGAIIGFILWKRKQNMHEVYSPESSHDTFKNDFGSFHDPYPAPPRPLMDPRLNPAMLGDPRISIASLADARDYSRQVLTVTNPDEKT